MANLEKGAHFEASPEDFGYGRVVTRFTIRSEKWP